ncbi:MAG: replicative DNA helicase [Candidatus Krumholzibacteriia bacterium]
MEASLQPQPPMSGRRPPCNLDAERAILGAALLDRGAVGVAHETLRGGEFYLREHRLIFGAMLALYDAEQAIDPITVGDQLRKQGELEAAGGMDYITELQAMVATAANVSYHAGIVRETGILRELITASGDTVNECMAGEGEAAEILDAAQGRFLLIGENARRGDFVGLDEVVPHTFAAIEEAARNGSDVTGLRSGFVQMDRMTSGLQKGDLLILAARPSMGKTSLALNLAYNVATRENAGTAIFSLEMGREQLVLRMLCSATGFNLHNVRRGKLRAEDWPRLTRACDQLSRAPVYIDDTPGMTVLEMKSKARRLQQQHGLGLIIIDYLQLMTGSARAESRQQEISQISRSLKGMAKDLNVPVLALSQLSRAVESRADHKPMLSDLRESGSIEQDADVVMFIFREEYYNPDDEEVRNKATVIVGKQRNGPTGEFDLHFHKEFTRFSDLVPTAQEAPPPGL